MLELGSVFAGRYKIVEVLGHGGMGSVYKAEDLKLKTTIALKLLLPDYQSQPEVINRFLREIRLALKITHENVVRIYDLGEVDNVYYISMEYIEGLDLKSLIERKQKFPIQEGVDLIRQVLSGLSVAHAKGIVHRDIKPQNIIIMGTNVAKIVDFGIAKIAGEASATAGMTKKDMIIGTPEYMSPEQALAREVDARTDIYALGIVMFEMFTGQPPFASDTAINLLIKQVKQQPPEPRQLNPDIPPTLGKIILRALAKNPEDRFQSVNEMLKILDAFSMGDPEPLLVDVKERVDDSNATSINAFEAIEDVYEELVEEVDTAEDAPSLFARGMELFKAREYSKAVALFHIVLEKDSTYSQAYDYIEIAGQQIAKEATVNRLMASAESAFVNKDYATALANYEDILTISPDHPAGQIGVKKTRAVFTPTSLTSNKTADQPVSDSSDVDVLFDRGRQYFEQKKFKEAYDIFQSVLAQQASHAQAYEYLERAKAAASAQEEIEHHFLTARRLLEEGDLEASIQELAIALDYDPEHKDSLDLLQRLRQVSGDDTILQNIVRGVSGPLPGVESAHIPDLASRKSPEFVTLNNKLKLLLKEYKYDEALAELVTAKDTFPQFSDKIATQIKKVELDKKKYLFREHFQKAEEFYKTGKFHQAMTMLKKALEIDPRSAHVNQLMAECRARLAEDRSKRDLETQKKVSRKSAGQDPESMIMPRRSRRTSFLAGAVVVIFALMAIAVVVLLPQIKATFSQQFIDSGQVYFKQRQFAEAAAAYKRAYSLNPAPEVLEKLAESLFYSGVYDEAQLHFKQLAREKPAEVKYNYFLGQIALKTGKADQAKDSLLKALKEDPRNETIHNSLGLVYLQESNYAKAIHHFKSSLQIRQDQPETKLLLARAAAHIKDYGTAIHYYQQVIKDSPDNDEAYNELGRMYIDQGSYGSAISVLKKHPAIKTGNAGLSYNLGLCYDKLAQTKKGSEWVSDVDTALDHYKNCFIIKMDHEDVVHKLVNLLKARGNKDYAIQIYQQYLDEHPDDIEALIEQADLYQGQKKFSQAFSNLDRAARIDSQDYSIWNKLGFMYLKSGNKLEAKNAFRKSLDINRNQPSIKAKYNSL